MKEITRSELRTFGLTVGGAFLLLGLVSWARGHEIAPAVLWVLGIFLVVPALLAPALLGPVRGLWMRGANLLGEVNSRVILGALFYLVFAPVGFVRRCIRDPLDRALDDGRPSNWIKRASEPLDPARYERQF